MAWLKPKQWEPLSAIPIAAGIVWLFGGHGIAWWIFALVPGTLMLASGVSLLFWPGDLRHTEYLGAAAFVGMFAAIPEMIVGGFGIGALCLVLAIACFLVSGRLALAREPVAEGAPEPDRSIAMDAKVALDEALLGYFVGSARIASGDATDRMIAETFKLERSLEAGGWLSDPSTFHHAPPAPLEVSATPRRLFGHDYQALSWRSEFVAHADLPGSQHWANQKRNGQCAAWMLKHADGPRPWIVCIHGYRMGHAWMDFGLFPPGWLHERLGLNVLMPVLPAHGPRRIGARSGDFYLDGDLFNVVHAQTQALWDLRSALRWIRAQEPNARIGVLGYSLGGYNASLLGAFEDALDFIVAGIPVIDFASALMRHLPPEHLRYLQAQGLDEERYRRILQVISPLVHPARIAPERRYIFAGAGDRVVLPAHPIRLAKHWDVPVQWYQGAHLTFRRAPQVRAHIEAAMQRAGWPIEGRLGRAVGAA
ncbi:MAG TPA: hypothetical protein VFB36_09385 [Nevskiaceae bacterium]|nr:hypothetical protein [Nevskiaceae bacterium]